MNSLKLIILISLIFISISLSITYFLIKNNQPKNFNCTTPDSIPICGTNLFLTESKKAGKNLFNSNCLACHSLDKNFTGPALRNIDSLQFISWLSKKNEKLDTTKMSEFKIDYHKITWNNKLSITEINQLIEYCKN